MTHLGRLDPKEIPPEAWQVESFHMLPSPPRSPFAHLENGLIASFRARLAEGRGGVKDALGSAEPRENSCVKGS